MQLFKQNFTFANVNVEREIFTEQAKRQKSAPQLSVGRK